MLYGAAIRGVDANVVIGEEAAHIKTDIYTLLIWPLLRVLNTCVFLISTPLNQYNYASILMHKKHPETGEYLFKLLSATQACSDCLRKGVNKCSHVMASHPPHLTLSRNVWVKELYGNDQNTMQQEILSIPSGKEELSFQPYVEELSNVTMSGSYALSNTVQVLHSFFDPSGGGRSDAAVVTHTLDEHGMHVITGMDRCGRRESNEGWIDYKNMLMRHFDSHVHQYPNAFIVIAIEIGADPGRSNETGSWLTDRYGSRVHIIKGSKGHPDYYGVVTTNAEKRQWTMKGTELFSQKLIRFINDDAYIGANREEVMTEFFEQMKRWAHREEERGDSDSFKKIVHTFDGKAGGLNDDMIGALTAGLWQAYLTRTSPTDHPLSKLFQHFNIGLI